MFRCLIFELPVDGQFQKIHKSRNRGLKDACKLAMELKNAAYFTTQ